MWPLREKEAAKSDTILLEHTICVEFSPILYYFLSHIPDIAGYFWKNASLSKNVLMADTNSY
jgi:hypothetical protein